MPRSAWMLLLEVMSIWESNHRLEAAAAAGVAPHSEMATEHHSLRTLGTSVSVVRVTEISGVYLATSSDGRRPGCSSTQSWPRFDPGRSFQPNTGRATSCAPFSPAPSVRPSQEQWGDVLLQPQTGKQARRCAGLTQSAATVPWQPRGRAPSFQPDDTEATAGELCPHTPSRACVLGACRRCPGRQRRSPGRQPLMRAGRRTADRWKGPSEDR